jgi:hypothetical protein
VIKTLHSLKVYHLLSRIRELQKGQPSLKQPSKHHKTGQFQEKILTYFDMVILNPTS